MCYTILDPQARINPHYKTENSENEELFRVSIIDNDVNTYEEVMHVCMMALGISLEEAYQIALAVDNNGYATVFEGTRSQAEHVAGIIRTIGIEVRVEVI